MSGVAQTRETDANLAPVTQVARAQFVRVPSAARCGAPSGGGRATLRGHSRRRRRSRVRTHNKEFTISKA